MLDLNTLLIEVLGSVPAIAIAYLLLRSQIKEIGAKLDTYISEHRELHAAEHRDLQPVERVR